MTPIPYQLTSMIVLAVTSLIIVWLGLPVALLIAKLFPFSKGGMMDSYLITVGIVAMLACSVVGTVSAIMYVELIGYAPFGIAPAAFNPLQILQRKL